MVARVVNDTLLHDTLARISPVDAAWLERAAERQDQLTKPARSLGRLEEIANRICAIQATLAPAVTRRRIIVCAADHAVAASRGTSAYPSVVTRHMVENFRAGGAAINALARHACAELVVVDAGVSGARFDPDTNETRAHARFVDARVRDGSADISREAAMSEAEALRAIEVGITLADQAARDGIAIIGLGEMGIGNTTAASAIAAALTGSAPDLVTGRGTGADDATYKRKVAAVTDALRINRPRERDALDVLRGVGGLEIAALCGVCLGAAANRIAVVTDGFIATAAAALAVRLCDATKDYLFAAHLSTEPGHQALLDVIKQKPLLDLDMRLGEGSGAALALPIIAAAVEVFRGMRTFAEARVATADDANTSDAQHERR